MICVITWAVKTCLCVLIWVVVSCDRVYDENKTVCPDGVVVIHVSTYIFLISP